MEPATDPWFPPLCRLEIMRTASRGFQRRDLDGDPAGGGCPRLDRAEDGRWGARDLRDSSKSTVLYCAVLYKLVFS